MKKNRRIRIYLPFILLFFILGVIEVRLYHLQILCHSEFAEQSRKEQENIISVLPERGIIYDRNREKLAINIPSYSLYASPPKVSHPEEVAKRLSSILKMESSEILKRLRKEKSFVWIKRKLSLAEKKKIEEFSFEGLGFIEEVKRFYPEKNLASHLLGFVGVDNQGLEGLEYFYDEKLRGKKGYFLVEEDALGFTVPFTTKVIQPPSPGKDIILTIDARIQSIVEEEISRVFKLTAAKSVEALFMDPQTGEILALACKPDYDPNFFSHYSSSVRINRVIQSLYEPGSTFKCFTAAALLEEGLVNLEENIPCDGPLCIADHTFYDWKKFEGDLSFIQVMQDSSDIGMIRVAKRLNEELFYKYIRLFGFGRKTGIDFPGEGKGIVRPPAQWSLIDFPCISIGQGIAVTPLQMVTAFCALINGGRLLRPYLVKYISTPEGKVVEVNKPQMIEKVISSSTSQKIRKILKEVVEGGTGMKAQVRGYSLAGKTGTAQIPASDRRGYLPDKYIASFIGFAPADSPEIAGIVIVKEPAGVYWGGEVAAPLFGQILKRVLPYLNILPEESLLKVIKAEYLFDEKGEDTQDTLLSGIMPDLKGLTMREALKILSRIEDEEIELYLSGSGILVSQYPLPGKKIKYKEKIFLKFAPP
ncbi:PASTA domain-containing protein [Candidatus Aerophobetes bacterium]|nr:PASTA domain-containing protein [Candidatus Aerophobetes bacterium]